MNQWLAKVASMNYEELLKEYHRRIGEIFLAKDQTPYRICKQLWALHAEFENRLTLIAADAEEAQC